MSRLVHVTKSCKCNSIFEKDNKSHGTNTETEFVGASNKGQQATCSKNEYDQNPHLLFLSNVLF